MALSPLAGAVLLIVMALLGCTAIVPLNARMMEKVIIFAVMLYRILVLVFGKKKAFASKLS